mgnify:CR=1 FL=1
MYVNCSLFILIGGICIIKIKYQNIEKQSATIDNFSKIDYVKGYCELTSFGESFCSICLETQKGIILKAQEG